MEQLLEIVRRIPNMLQRKNVMAPTSVHKTDEVAQPTETEQKRGALRAEATLLANNLDSAGLLPLEGPFRSESIKLITNLVGIGNAPINYRNWITAVWTIDTMAASAHRAVDGVKPTQELGYRGQQLQRDEAMLALPVYDHVLVKLVDIIKRDMILSGEKPEEVTRLMRSVLDGLKTYEPPTQVIHND